MLVRVNASIHNSSKEVVHDAGEGLGVQHAVQCTHKHRLAGVQTLGGAAHVVAVGDHPGDHLYLGCQKEKEMQQNRSTQQNETLGNA